MVRKLESFRNVFCSYINDQQIRKIIGKLYESRGISTNTIDEIKSESTRLKRIDLLLSHIITCDVVHIKTFLSILEFEFPHLYEEITGNKSRDYDLEADVSLSTFKRLNYGFFYLNLEKKRGILHKIETKFLATTKCNKRRK
jgi:hypothetical protein